MVHAFETYASHALHHTTILLRGLVGSTLFMVGGLLASPFALGCLCYIGWRTGTDSDFHWSQTMGRSVENVDRIKCNVIRLIESVKRLEADLCHTESEIDESFDSSDLLHRETGEEGSCNGQVVETNDESQTSSEREILLKKVEM